MLSQLRPGYVRLRHVRSGLVMLSYVRPEYARLHQVS
jgi:hypothetical protein